jgi:hypothetical protein
LVLVVGLSFVSLPCFGSADLSAEFAGADFAAGGFAAYEVFTDDDAEATAAFAAAFPGPVAAFVFFATDDG